MVRPYGEYSAPHCPYHQQHQSHDQTLCAAYAPPHSDYGAVAVGTERKLFCSAMQCKFSQPPSSLGNAAKLPNPARSPGLPW
eukprot:457360-Amphidinium_carterae.3